MFSATLPAGSRVVILGTGGTIAGTGHDASRPWHYDAAQLGVQDLLAGVPALVPLGEALVAEQVAQVDSKDMDVAVWLSLVSALARHLADPLVLGVVITHGTDTLEETAALLHWLTPPGKPVVLTAAMRPATASDADGPGNLSDSVATVLKAHSEGWGGVVAVLAGRVWSARDVRKAHSHRVDAFDGGGQSPLADGVHGALHEAWPAINQPWPQPLGLGLRNAALLAPWPHVPVLTSHGAADARLLDAAMQVPGARPDGVLLACSGHGTVHAALQASLKRAEVTGVTVWRSSRVARGGVMARAGDTWPATGPWTAAQARLGLQLHLLGVGLNAADLSSV